VCCALGFFAAAALGVRRVASCRSETVRARDVPEAVENRAPARPGWCPVRALAALEAYARDAKADSRGHTSWLLGPPDAPAAMCAIPVASSRLRLRVDRGVTCGARADGLSWRALGVVQVTSPRGLVRPRDIRTLARARRAAHFDAGAAGR